MQYIGKAGFCLIFVAQWFVQWYPSHKNPGFNPGTEPVAVACFRSVPLSLFQLVAISENLAVTVMHAVYCIIRFNDCRVCKRCTSRKTERRNW